MHPYLFFAIHHALVLSVVAFFILFAASKANGFVKLLGNVLGYLLLVVALLCILCAATAPMFGGHPFGLTMMDHMHPGHRTHRRRDRHRDHFLDNRPENNTCPPCETARAAALE